MNCIHAKLYYKYDVYITSCVRQTSENDIDKCEDITLISNNISKFLWHSEYENSTFVCTDCGKIFTYKEWSDYYYNFLNIVNTWYSTRYFYGRPLSRKKVERNLIRENKIGPEIRINGKSCRCIHAILNTKTNQYDMLTRLEFCGDNVQRVCKLCNMNLGSIFSSMYEEFSYYDGIPLYPYNYETTMIRQPLWPEEMAEKLKDTGLLGPDIGEGKYIGFKRAKQE